MNSFRCCSLQVFVIPKQNQTLTERNQGLRGFGEIPVIPPLGKSREYLLGLGFLSVAVPLELLG